MDEAHRGPEERIPLRASVAITAHGDHGISRVSIGILRNPWSAREAVFDTTAIGRKPEFMGLVGEVSRQRLQTTPE